MDCYRFLSPNISLQAKQAAHMAIGLARKVQDVLKLCSLCSNEDSNNTEQLVLNNKIANLTEKTIMMKNSSFVLDGLANTLGENSSSGIASASVRSSCKIIYTHCLLLSILDKILSCLGTN